MRNNSEKHSGHCCEDMQLHLEMRKIAILYIPKFREYGIRDLDGGPVFQQMLFCPWCGRELPSGLRDEWFERIWELGLEPEDPNIPDELTSDLWWKGDQGQKKR